MRSWLGFVGTLAFATLAVRGVISCSEPSATPFGNPNGLDRKNLPGEGGAEPLTCAGDAGGSLDGGCPSFATDIYPALRPTGAWRCSDQVCHGGATLPAISSTSAAACLDSLRKIKVKDIPYVVAADGGKDPSASSLLCNLHGSCGSKMPKPPGVDLTNADLCKIEVWLKCGAPP
jgi:hypothetical protein